MNKTFTIDSGQAPSMLNGCVTCSGTIGPVCMLSDCLAPKSLEAKRLNGYFTTHSLTHSPAHSPAHHTLAQLDTCPSYAASRYALTTLRLRSAGRHPRRSQELAVSRAACPYTRRSDHRYMQKSCAIECWVLSWFMVPVLMK